MGGVETADVGDVGEELFQVGVLGVGGVGGGGEVGVGEVLWGLLPHFTLLLIIAPR